MSLKYILMSVVVMLGFTACEFDNYDAPSYEFNGQLVTDDGQPFLFDANKTLFKFYQTGFGKDDPGMNMTVDNNGVYKQLLFDGNYELTLVNQPLPFEMPEFPAKANGQGYERIPYNIEDGVSRNFVVRPYYTISNLNAVLSDNGKNIIATFDVAKMTNTEKAAPKIKSARLYLGTSIIVDSGTSCLRSQAVSSPEQTSIRVQIPLAYYRDKRYYINNFRTYAYYRVSIELEGVPDYFLFSEIKKIEGLPVE